VANVVLLQNGIALLLALPLGIGAALRPGTWLDGTSMGISLLGVSLPNMWLGPLLLLGFSIHLAWFPGPAPDDPRAFGALVLPAITLGTALMAMLSRMTRASLLGVMGEDYIRTARAKGLAERMVVYKHALRNALMPIVTIAGLQFGNLISGAVLVETVFSWPGLGTLALDSILGRDYPTLLGALTFSAILVIVANLLTDLTYRWIDPRLRTR